MMKCRESERLNGDVPLGDRHGLVLEVGETALESSFTREVFD